MSSMRVATKPLVANTFVAATSISERRNSATTFCFPSTAALGISNDPQLSTITLQPSDQRVIVNDSQVIIRWPKESLCLNQSASRKLHTLRRRPQISVRNSTTGAFQRQGDLT